MKIENILKEGYKLKEIYKENDYYIFVFYKKGFSSLWITLKEIPISEKLKGGIKE